VVVDPNPTRLAPIIAYVHSLQRDQPFCPLQTFQINRMYRQRGLPWTAHSFKRGAVNVATQAAVAHEIPDRFVSLLAKHVHPDNAFPPATLRYASDDIAKALLLGTQKLTKWL
jgi:hypothetical protein